ncbi:MAG: RuvA C-terminal domain-containing protein [Candidatus Acidiferrales bacterium]
MSFIFSIIVYPIVVYAIFFDRKARNKSPQVYRRERAYRRAEIAAARYAALPVVVREAREARSALVRKAQATVKVEVPAFLVDVESALINLQYKKKEAAQAAQRATGDDFGTRLKNALELLRSPDTKLTA